MQLSGDNSNGYAGEPCKELAPDSESACVCEPGEGGGMAKRRQSGSLRKAAKRASQSAKNESEGVPSLPLNLPVDQLLSAIETQLIPRLLVSHRGNIGNEDSVRKAPAPGVWSSAERVSDFASLCIVQGADKVTEHVSSLLSRGVALDAIYIHLIAPAANLLGEQWANDEASFVDVQLGLTRMHQLVSECERIGYRNSDPGEAKTILLAAAPGEQHTFGIRLAADFFERSGWMVSNLSGNKEHSILQEVASCHYCAAGLSLHNAAWLDALRKLLPKIRRHSMNPDILLIVGGDFFVRNPAVGDTLGADLIGTNAHQAVLDAEQRLKNLASIDSEVPVS